MADSAASGFEVFVSYASEDHDRLLPIVEYLEALGFTIWWDDFIDAGSTWRQVLEEQLGQVGCVIVFWSSDSVQSSFVEEEATRGLERRVLLPVLLDNNARIPASFADLHYVDLTSWKGDMGDLVALSAQVQKFADRGTGGPAWTGSDLTIDGAISQPAWATDELVGITSQVRTVGDLLDPGSEGAGDLELILKEVSDTYDVVCSAIEKFIAPAIEGDHFDVKPYVAMERGSLRKIIENGRGHCSRILRRYGRRGGLRSQIAKGHRQKLTLADEAFTRLATADADLFASLAGIGDTLTGEAAGIVHLLLLGNKRAARKRIIEGRATLAPLEKKLGQALDELQQVQAALGFAERADE